ncbi:hypothetical protein [Streptomyces sp. ICBB 8177]|uniref:hypothetical protein n=1 Tax=Streptomyces sp. ICBB 8177 TaxID=563922 RepID=UPI001305417F|nr:hypothetical protein [Streptomyces sp. ICBB 8177]
MNATPTGTTVRYDELFIEELTIDLDRDCATICATCGTTYLVTDQVADGRTAA